MNLALSSFNLAIVSENEDQYGLDEAGGSVWAAADLAEDLTVLELGVGPLTRAELAAMRCADLALVAGEPPPASLGIMRSTALGDGDTRTAAAIICDHAHSAGMHGLDGAVLVGCAYVVLGAGQRLRCADCPAAGSART